MNLPNFDTLVENILAVYNQAAEIEKTESIQWYDSAFIECTKIGELFGVDSKAAIAVCAVLSPNNNWNRNLIDLMTVLRAFESGKLEKLYNEYKAGKKTAFHALGIATYSPNIAKAFEILTGNFDSLKGQKVTAFFHNIYYPNSELVTIDFHAYSIAVNFRHTAKTCPNISAAENRILQDAYKTAAEKIGLLPKQLQAVTWVVWRRLHNIRFAG